MSSKPIRINEECLTKICDAHGIQLLLLFGSRARGSEHSHSDIDLAYDRDTPLTFNQETDLRTQLRNAFPDKPADLDLVYIPFANPLLLRKISESASLLHGEEKAFKLFLLRAFHRYSDFRPYFRFEREELRRRLGEMSSG